MIDHLFDLTELRFVGEFHDTATLHEFMTEAVKIAGGVSLLDMRGVHCIAVGVPHDYDVIHRVHELVKRFRYRTRFGLMQISGKDEGLALYLPVYKNADPSDQAEPLFPNGTRGRLVRLLAETFGPYTSHRASGVWRSDAGQLVEDESDVFTFDICEADDDEIVRMVRHQVLLHPDSDQESVYVSLRGRAMLINRDDPATGIIRLPRAA